MARKKIPTAAKPEGKEAEAVGMPRGHVYSDTLLVTPDECVEHVAHHLRLAAMFYQSTPKDETETEAEVLHILALKHGKDDPAYLAGLVFLVAIREYYEALRKRHEAE